MYNMFMYKLHVLPIRCMYVFSAFMNVINLNISYNRAFLRRHRHRIVAIEVRLRDAMSGFRILERPRYYSLLTLCGVHPGS